MHSVRRVRTTAEQRAAKRAREAGEIASHQRLLAAILKRDNADPGALKRTTELLSYYPEQYTVWNIRREILSLITENKEAALKHELLFTQQLLPSHPKVYWIWNHRRWVLDQLPGAYAGELLLTTKLLERDARNFHGWNYRWYVVNAIVAEKTDPQIYEHEFAFTTKKINENFSNFSAWHFRAQCIPKLRQAPAFASELNYVMSAVGMDPQDQSGWLYLQWLLGSSFFAGEVTAEVLRNQHEVVSELLEEEPCVYAARTLQLLNKQLGQPDPPNLAQTMAELDPLRSGRYQQRVEHAQR